MHCEILSWVYMYCVWVCLRVWEKEVISVWFLRYDELWNTLKGQQRTEPCRLRVEFARQSNEPRRQEQEDPKIRCKVNSAEKGTDQRAKFLNNYKARRLTTPWVCGVPLSRSSCEGGVPVNIQQLRPILT
jgi:hypothetical protein